MDLISYLMTLTPEQAREAIQTLSVEQKAELVKGLCGSIDRMAQAIVENKDQIWSTSELLRFECSPPDPLQ